MIWKEIQCENKRLGKFSNKSKTGRARVCSVNIHLMDAKLDKSGGAEAYLQQKHQEHLHEKGSSSALLGPPELWGPSITQTLFYLAYHVAFLDDTTAISIVGTALDVLPLLLPCIHCAVACDAFSHHSPRAALPVSRWSLWSWELKAKVQFKLRRPLLQYDLFLLKMQLSQPLSAVMVQCLHYMAMGIEDFATERAMQKPPGSTHSDPNEPWQFAINQRWTAWYMWALACSVIGKKFAPQTVANDDNGCIDEVVSWTDIQQCLEARLENNLLRSGFSTLTAAECLNVFPKEWHPHIVHVYNDSFAI